MKKIDELSCVASEQQPDIILLTETWCHPDISNAYLSLENYELVPDLRRDRADTGMGRGGGGLLVYVKTGIKIFALDNLVQFHQYCVFKVFDITFYLIYRSPNAPPTAIAGLIELAMAAPKNSILIGDFNLPEVLWDQASATGRTRELREALEEKHMTQLIDFPTQVRGNILDLVITDIPERFTELFASGHLGASDHVSITAKVAVGKPVNKSKKTILNWRRADFTGMREELSCVSWEEIFRHQKTEDMWAAFKSRLHAAVNKYVPVKPASPLGRPPWISREITAALRRKRRLWRHARTSGQQEEYTAADKEVKKLIRKSKRAYEKKLAAGGQNQKRQFFAYVKKKTKSQATVGPLLDSKKNKVTGDKEMADILNDYFSSVFSAPVDHAPNCDTQGPGISDLIVTSETVKKKILRLRPASAAGPDKIGPQLLQELVDCVSPALAAIFNSSLAEGVVPMDWRQANVTPIYKKGAKADPGNYRPVSLTSVCCKLMEGVIKDAMMEHLQAEEIIRPSQHGFMPNRSCTTNLLEFLELATKSVDEGEPFDVIFLDFAKAFDKVPHLPLLAKLEAAGVGGRLLQWIRAWLKDRQQRVVLNGAESDWAAVTSGVPQGSILGPILFVIYINDIDLVIRLIDAVKKFADDTKLGQRVGTAEQRERLQAALDALTGWAATWGMLFNVKKCKVMHLGHNNPRQVYTMLGQALEKTQEERDVGVMVTSSLKPSVQCAKAAQTANMVLGQLTRAFHYRDRHIFIRLYKQYVLPHLEFAGTAWSPWTAADKETLEKVQRRAVKMVAGLAATDYEARLAELGMVTLEERRHQQDMAQVYRIVHGHDRVDPCQWFTKVNDERVTRRAADPLNLVAGRSRLDLRRNFFSQRIVEHWNKIPADLKRARTVFLFKKGYKHLRQAMVQLV